jgi:hypothetical protein
MTLYERCDVLNVVGDAFPGTEVVVSSFDFARGRQQRLERICGVRRSFVTGLERGNAMRLETDHEALQRCMAAMVGALS